MKKRVLITQRIPEIAIDRLSEFFDLTYFDNISPFTESELVQKSQGHFAILSFLSDNISGKLISSVPDLKIIANYAVGVNNIDLKSAEKNGIIVSNTPDVLTDASADLALALLMSVGRRIIEADQFCRDGNFLGWESTLMLGYEFSGKNCGIIGMGRIGSAFSKRAESLGMKIYYHNRNELPKNSATYLSLEELLKSCHVISIHLPLNQSTKKILDSEKLNLLMEDSILINTGRGELIDESHLAEMLRNKRIFGAGLDVFEQEPIIHPSLLKLKNVVLTPHIGSATVTARNKMALLAADSIIMCSQNKEIPNRVI